MCLLDFANLSITFLTTFFCHLNLMLWTIYNRFFLKLILNQVHYIVSTIQQNYFPQSYSPFDSDWQRSNNSNRFVNYPSTPKSVAWEFRMRRNRSVSLSAITWMFNIHVKFLLPNSLCMRYATWQIYLAYSSFLQFSFSLDLTYISMANVWYDVESFRFARDWLVLYTFK